MIVFPIQTVVVFADGDGDLSYWFVNAVILAAGIGLNRLGWVLGERRRSRATETVVVPAPNPERLG